MDFRNFIASLLGVQFYRTRSCLESFAVPVPKGPPGGPSWLFPGLLTGNHQGGSQWAHINDISAAYLLPVRLPGFVGVIPTA